MNAVLAEWNEASEADAVAAMLACCGAQRWAKEMAALRPLRDITALSETADTVWGHMEESDWREAFACHPRIGERKSEEAKTRSAEWSSQEQEQVTSAQMHTLGALVVGNTRYEEKFGFTYIVCATGRSAEEMLAILERRLTNTREEELSEAAEQQRQILQIRLGKWLTS
ncbi:MAG TPA: 2-oxo-4-hydroxy-4-carboxy-5-ureidoimidazoline decarboxylase [Terracidiphilus sp.]|nr:2-oxo-4-hydroxy-4-carboxy-5-ureidoimidazoline decarboxylase [Terracidiphilus sp.]